MYKIILIFIISTGIVIITDAFYRLAVVDPQLWGRTIPKEYAEKICMKTYSFPKQNGINFLSGAFTENKSKSKTTVCHFEFCENESVKCDIIIGYLDELSFADSIDVSEKEFKSIFSFKDDKTVERVKNSYRVYMPWTLFNLRIVPEGKYLSLNGFSPTASKESINRIGAYQVKSIEGSFQNLTFVVIPNTGFIKNIAKELRFYQRRYGSVYFLKDSNGYVAMIIASVPLNEQKQYGQCTKALQKIIEGLTIGYYK